jgi:hypothetical protein
MVLVDQSANRRQSISRNDLQSAITGAVKKSDPDCEAFVDIIVEHVPPKSRFDANWAVRGVKFGRSDRGKSTAALLTIVARMQQEFKLSDDSSI